MYGYLARLHRHLEDVLRGPAGFLGLERQIAEGEDHRLVLVVLILDGRPELLGNCRQARLQELAAPAARGLALLAQPFAEDHEVASGSRERHIEQVEVVDDVLKMFLTVVGLIDCSRHRRP